MLSSKGELAIATFRTGKESEALEHLKEIKREAFKLKQT